VENLYLIAGVRGAFASRTLHTPVAVGGDLLHALDRWGIPAPWGPCDSGADLESVGADVLRAWTHVDLRRSDDERPPNDVPVSGLLRTTWDALEIYGTIDLSGVDAIVPSRCAGEQMWVRVTSVATSILRDRARTSDPPPHVLVSVGCAYSAHPDIYRDVDLVVSTLSDLVEVLDGTSVELRPFEAQAQESPFRPLDSNLFRVEVLLPAWTVDDAGWLVEAVCLACSRAGIGEDIQIGVTLLQPR
jgi:hypothetical protein